MRFERYGHFDFTDTRRKRLAFERKQQKERDAYPLFRDVIAGEQITVNEEMEQRAARWSRQESSDRKSRAAKWRRARARLRSYEEPARQQLAAYWQRCQLPATPTYLLDMLHSYDGGKLDMNPPNPRQTEAQRVAVSEVIKKLLARNMRAAAAAQIGQR